MKEEERAVVVKKLVIVIPAYNEEEVFPETVKEITEILEGMISSNKVSADSKILFVNDGSKDNTWNLIINEQKNNELVTGINFSRNFGHQNALVAGLVTASKDADMMITIDADLQDDVNAIEKMVDQYYAGFDVVYGVRDNRDTDTAFKRSTALTFYGIMKKLGVDMVPNHADYRLMSQRAVLEFLKFKEENLFIRGIVPLVGFPSTKVYYARKERFAGESKYPLKKMLKFAWDGISSFSVVPIRAIMTLGVAVVIVAVGILVYAVLEHARGNTAQGWSSLMISLWFLGGVQLIGISVIGEYIGKIFNEVKHRPRFTIQDDTYTKVDK
ncbi:glycosyltransferase [Periweissella cryptocerci]|uniref:Glycosyltransferase n=1 Tax=Periweissella cryptocerci TaxID=2506420 RepID=A0A4P6YSG6_9LACO|nr:glycosyltransferase family 2 protein [Periweissella cryptocerci]QBO35606.1 glycosyltransferase [Periweissella cryptocerci]